MGFKVALVNVSWCYVKQNFNALTGFINVAEEEQKEHLARSGPFVYDPVAVSLGRESAVMSSVDSLDSSTTGTPIGAFYVCSGHLVSLACYLAFGFLCVVGIFFCGKYERSVEGEANMIKAKTTPPENRSFEE
ncbi:hypothetical protein QR680_013324 [Steinernema hermaphroditum]|uniref:Uncharacterized protein n=1 Tax=Steinernema hermaphroditum TaxID=289476 RepID=A0AA39I554_9BILA|nr:hypothetical protein QR680_013324 [Steinernema hermaphroditum]